MRAAVTVLSIALLASCSEQAQTQGPLFERGPLSQVNVGRGSGKIVLADLNSDGHLDLVTQHLLDSVVNVHVGDGKGHFAAAAGSPMRLAYQPGTIALGDVNNDRVIDLVVSHKDDTGEYVDIMRGDGRGFAKSLGARFRVNAALQFYKPMLRLVDVNQDDNIDIVTANGRRHTVEILLGDGRGGFAAPAVVSIGPGRGQDLSSFAIGDVDGDGLVDLVASRNGGPDAQSPGRLVTKRGERRRIFAAASPNPIELPPGAILETLADVNGDQRLDAVIRFGERNFLNVFLNEGKGTFASAPAARSEVEGDAFTVLVTDLNEDKRADLIVATVKSTAAPLDSKVAVFVGAGDGRGFVHAPGSPFPAGPGAFYLAVGDVDEDGRLDIAASSFGGDSVTILKGRSLVRQPDS